MTKEEVLSKVKKLFELSKSSNENEAALAAAKARELLSRHNLRMADLPADEMTNSLHAGEATVEVGKVLRNWVKGLMIFVARAFECEHVIRRRRGAAPILTFIGVDTDVEVASHTFRFLYGELNVLVGRALPQLKRENPGWNGGSLRYAYLDGAVGRIGERLREATQEIRVTEEKTCTDLVVAKEHLIFNYMKNNFPYLRKEYARRRKVSANAYEKGYADADNIDLKAGAESDDTERLLETA